PPSEWRGSCACYESARAPVARGARTVVAGDAGVAVGAVLLVAGASTFVAKDPTCLPLTAMVSCVFRYSTPPALDPWPLTMTVTRPETSPQFRSTVATNACGSAVVDPSTIRNEARSNGASQTLPDCAHHRLQLGAYAA